jgi:hypothetical protein
MSKKVSIKNQSDAIKYFIEQMDMEMIEAFLDSNKTYQDMNKDKFLAKLGLVFEKFKNSGDSYLISYSGKCNGCFLDKTGFTYIGNYSFNYISIIIDIENGSITDMFECSNFINKNQTMLLNKKLYIDDFVEKLISKLKR